MEEITTRFEIVRLAVKMADHETVAVQAKKLREISLDEDLNEIVSLLETKNYRQALFLMKGYVNSLDDSFFNEPSTTPPPKKPKAAVVPQETQNLFDMMQPQVSKTINLDDMLRMTEESAEETVGYHEPDRVAETYIAQAKEEVKKNEAYLDIYKNRAENKTVKPFEKTEEEEPLSDIHGEAVPVETVSELQPEPEVASVADTAGEATSDDPVEEVWESISEPEAVDDKQTEAVPAQILEDDDFIVDESVETENITEEEEAVDITETVLEEESEAEVAHQSPSLDTLLHLDPKASRHQPEEEGEEVLKVSPPANRKVQSTETEEQHIEAVSEEITPPVEKALVKEVDIMQTPSTAEENALKAKRKADYTKENRRYPPISYIDQKFRNMRHQFPQVEESENGVIEEVKVLLKQVSTQGYTENDIRDAILFFQEKKAEGKIAEAAQMLLLAAASESKYAQLLLARELFKGEVLKVDYPESFTQINRLAEHDYPEAICDLAQLYEYGYGIKKDKKTAQLLYEEAAEMGVERAQKHVERLSSKKGILRAFFK